MWVVGVWVCIFNMCWVWFCWIYLCVICCIVWFSGSIGGVVLFWVGWICVMLRMLFMMCESCCVFCLIMWVSCFCLVFCIFLFSRVLVWVIVESGLWILWVMVVDMWFMEVSFLVCIWVLILCRFLRNSMYSLLWCLF